MDKQKRKEETFDFLYHTYESISGWVTHDIRITIDYLYWLSSIFIKS